ncbi:MAG TPA: hypothetical protein VGC27_09715 [Rhizomicrobium sp.]
MRSRKSVIFVPGPLVVLTGLTMLRAVPSPTQITRHDCVEGWSCIGEWTGTPLSLILAAAKPKTNARLSCVPLRRRHGSGREAAQYYYESLDLLEAIYPPDNSGL